jgi:hypothetical protein
MQKPFCGFRPEPWLESLVEKEIRMNPLLKGSKTAAIHALIQKTADLEAKLKEAEADKETWKAYADSMAEFAKQQGWRKGQAPPKAPTE